eukprot:Nk52_evm1s64 gene=Nk52_evmTU1s64
MSLVLKRLCAFSVLWLCCVCVSHGACNSPTGDCAQPRSDNAANPQPSPFLNRVEREIKALKRRREGVGDGGALRDAQETQVVLKRAEACAPASHGSRSMAGLHYIDVSTSDGKILQLVLDMDMDAAHSITLATKRSCMDGSVVEEIKDTFVKEDGRVRVENLIPGSGDGADGVEVDIHVSRDQMIQCEKCDGWISVNTVVKLMGVGEEETLAIRRLESTIPTASGLVKDEEPKRRMVLKVIKPDKDQKKEDLDAYKGLAQFDGSEEKVSLTVISPDMSVTKETTGVTWDFTKVQIVVPMEMFQAIAKGVCDNDIGDNNNCACKNWEAKSTAGFKLVIGGKEQLELFFTNNEFIFETNGHCQFVGLLPDKQVK